MEGQDQPLYRQVESYLLRVIREDALEPGDVLPSIAMLTRTLGIHGLTIRRAVRELALRDVVVTRQGRGIFVSHGARARVLWVSGTQLFSVSVGQYQMSLIEHVRTLAEQAGLQIEPVTVSQFDAKQSQRWMSSSDKLRPFVGFVFCNCGLEHLLARHVASLGLPRVTIGQRGQVQPWHVSTDLAQADELAMDAMEAAGCKRVAVVGIDNQPLVTAEAVRARGLKPLIARLPPYHPYQGPTAEQIGYELGCSLLAANQKAQAGDAGSRASRHRHVDGWYLTDDVIARGATRAILAHEPDPALRPVVVVRTMRQQMTSLGMPVQYITTDLHLQAQQTLELLQRQISQTTGPSHYINPYVLADASSLISKNASEITFSS